MSEILLDYKNVSINHSEVTVLKNLTQQIRVGELVYLTGKVGSGKSSFLKSIYADAEVSAGSATVLNYDIRKIKRKEIPYLRRELGIIFQDFKLLTDRSVEKNLDFVLRATEVSDKSERKERIANVLAYVGMDNKGYKMPHELSGGEQQRIVIARALLNDPKMILADEPTGNLDAETGKDIMTLLHKISLEKTAVVMATHNMKWPQIFEGRVLKFNEMEVNEISVAEAVTTKNEE
ncbi:MAG: ATP-binding cassette domain-containing protein [Paludibacteraceae bacterium]|nr:ATP-binding cassette domain-containing protein [Paludibacteraceae bacterium]MBP5525322.1 ATP-binding cassette domain-containing protein [Paludibacteraceae bacterium]MBR6111650.1 ATP-binding cassette domain-containing protein [Paludibacteraceae bacterium]MCR5247971.1 ATP-binding cassette domain-containing protein [Paludibacteraceae bacterium]MEE0083685.1 ATP-binding cassette domain-containing protein [Paludibacteraceae bacterium]